MLMPTAANTAPLEFSADSLRIKNELPSNEELAAILLDAPQYMPAFVKDPYEGWPEISYKSDPVLACFLAAEAHRLVTGRELDQSAVDQDDSRDGERFFNISDADAESQEYDSLSNPPPEENDVSMPEMDIQDLDARAAELTERAYDTYQLASAFFQHVKQYRGENMDYALESLVALGNSRDADAMVAMAEHTFKLWQQVQKRKVVAVDMPSSEDNIQASSSGLIRGDAWLRQTERLQNHLFAYSFMIEHAEIVGRAGMELVEKVFSDDGIHKVYNSKRYAAGPHGLTLTSETIDRCISIMATHIRVLYALGRKGEAERLWRKLSGLVKDVFPEVLGSNPLLHSYTLDDFEGHSFQLYHDRWNAKGIEGSISSKDPDCDFDIVNEVNEDFFRDYVDARKPALIRSFFRKTGWSKFKWTLQSFWSNPEVDFPKLSVMVTDSRWVVLRQNTFYDSPMAAGTKITSLEHYIDTVASIVETANKSTNSLGGSRELPYLFAPLSPEAADSLGLFGRKGEHMMGLMTEHFVTSSRFQTSPDNWLKSALFYIGPPGAGASFHRHMSALNVLASGEKQWYMLPPGIDYVGSAADSTAEWEAFVRQKMPFRPMQCKQKAGDAVWVPPGYVHGVRNLDVSVGITVQFGDDMPV